MQLLKRKATLTHFSAFFWGSVCPLMLKKKNATDKHHIVQQKNKSERRRQQHWQTLGVFLQVVFVLPSHSDR
jgi:hypothetical protein